MNQSTPPILESIGTVEKAYTIFNSVLGNKTPAEVFEKKLLTISDDKERLYEHIGNNNPLAEAIFEADFPRVCGPVNLDHYTSIDTLRKIVGSQKLYLHPLAKRLTECEFTTFAKEHKLDGYFDSNKEGTKFYNELSNDLFYISLTSRDNPNKNTLWHDFGNEGGGVRLTLRVSPKSPSDLHKMGYQTEESTALKRVNDKLSCELGLVYIPWTISLICAFYLPLGFSNEQEVRLMMKRHQGGKDLTIKAGEYEVWPIKLAALGTKTCDPVCEIELVEVTAGTQCSTDAIRNILNCTSFSKVPINKCNQ